ncbi:energy-coupling factor transporter ATPase [Laceyella sacchari]|jgi:energy-coupling factor transport system ATP-binding protein|uniref:Energy-coupling factor transporter ATPase n=1 Tax=Laceyella sacchari TaxID=37482 RepID=A0ABY5U775_LACSH|nr:energy-coupling factor transporter ATPase [Laceyella sacchari]TCW36708.1 energy-coupling factor transport system ATP-binding protein [Laceyella sacchari]UWE03888.1 energy-coupling factor transporter ATPase [Laceyella sacchari]
MEPILHVSNLRFHYQPDALSKERWALKDIQLTVGAGEYVSIIGPNGSGKSTLARIIAGLYLPTEGDVHVCGRATSNEHELWQIRRRVGMVFQNPDNQIVAPTVQDDVAFGLENMGLPRDEMKARVAQALQWVGLAGMEEREPHHLSGGQKQRLAIAGVVAMQPDIILFDEATSMLDPQGRSEVCQLIKSIHEQGTTVIHITHSAQEAFMAERLIVMAEGQIKLDTPVSELYPQAMKLKEWDLDVPLEVELHHRLVKAGWPVRASITSKEDLVSELWRLLSKT